MTYDEIKEDVIKIINTMTRFPIMDNLIDNPTPEEIERAMLDGVEDINNFKPVTDYDVETLYNKGSRWRRVFHLATEINIYRTLVKDWVANGLDASIEEFNLPNKLPDYQSLLADLEQKFENSVNALKAGKPVVRLGHYRTNNSSTYRSSAYASSICSNLSSGRKIC